MVALDSGSVNSFNLYVDLDRHSKDAGKAASIRQQLHEAGVSVSLLSFLNPASDLYMVSNLFKQRSSTAQVMQARQSLTR